VAFEQVRVGMLSALYATAAHSKAADGAAAGRRATEPSKSATAAAVADADAGSTSTAPLSRLLRSLS